MQQQRAGILPYHHFIAETTDIMITKHKFNHIKERFHYDAKGLWNSFPGNSRQVKQYEPIISLKFLFSSQVWQ